MNKYINADDWSEELITPFCPWCGADMKSILDHQ